MLSSCTRQRPTRFLSFAALNVAIGADRGCAQRARSVVQGGLAPLALRPEPVTSSLVLAASELVSNAYRYGRSGSAINLRLAAYDAMIRMEVRNEGALFRPRLRQADDDDIGGRGLLLVASVCDRFGTTHTPTHVTVWCEVDVSAEL